jgi:hypothetical protein
MNRGPTRPHAGSMTRTSTVGGWSKWGATLRGTAVDRAKLIQTDERAFKEHDDKYRKWK